MPEIVSTNTRRAKDPLHSPAFPTRCALSVSALLLTSCDRTPAVLDRPVLNLHTASSEQAIKLLTHDKWVTIHGNLDLVSSKYSYFDTKPDQVMMHAFSLSGHDRSHSPRIFLMAKTAMDSAAPWPTGAVVVTGRIDATFEGIALRDVQFIRSPSECR